MKWYFRRIHALRPEIYHIRFIQSFSTNDLKLAMQWIDPIVYYLIMQTPCEPSENYPHQKTTTSYIKGIYIYCHCALKKGTSKKEHSVWILTNFPRWKLLKLKQGGFSIHQQGFQVGARAMFGVLKPHHGAFMIPQNTQIEGKTGRFGFLRWEVSLHLYLERVFFFIQWVQRKMQQKLPWTCLASASGCWVISMFYIFALGFSGLKWMKIESKTWKNETVRVPNNVRQLNNVGCDSMKWSLKLPIVDPGGLCYRFSETKSLSGIMTHTSYIPK